MAPAVYRGQKKSSWCTANSTRHPSCLKELFKTYLFTFQYYPYIATASHCPRSTEDSKSCAVSGSWQVYVPKSAILRGVLQCHRAPRCRWNNHPVQGIAAFRQCNMQKHKRFDIKVYNSTTLWGIYDRAYVAKQSKYATDDLTATTHGTNLQLG
jgi:hypothetical protein